MDLLYCVNHSCYRLITELPQIDYFDSSSKPVAELGPYDLGSFWSKLNHWVGTRKFPGSTGHFTVGREPQWPMGVATLVVASHPFCSSKNKKKKVEHAIVWTGSTFHGLYEHPIGCFSWAHAQHWCMPCFLYTVKMYACVKRWKCQINKIKTKTKKTVKMSSTPHYWKRNKIGKCLN